MKRSVNRMILLALLPVAAVIALTGVIRARYQPAIPTYSPLSSLWELLGQVAAEQGKPAVAVSLFTRLPQENLSPTSQRMLGDAYLALGDPTQAIQAWQKAEPTRELYLRLAQAHRALRDYEAALADWQALLSLEPGNAQAVYQQGLLMAAIQPGQALVYLAQAATFDTPFAPSCLKLQRRIEAALLAGEEAYTLLESGRGLASLGEWELAAEAFRRATVLRPDYAEAWAFLGEAHRQLGQGGLAELQKALEISPTSLSAQLFLALYWRQQGEYERATQILTEAARLDERNPIVQVELGNTLAAQGEFENALLYYQRAVELAPSETKYWRILVEFSLQNQVQVHEVGLPAARQLVLLSPQDPAALDLMGMALLLLNDPLNAERFLQRAVQADTNYAPAHLRLAQVYLFQGNYTSARQKLELVLSLAPHTPLAEQAQRFLDNYFP